MRKQKALQCFTELARSAITVLRSTPLKKPPGGSMKSVLSSAFAAFALSALSAFGSMSAHAQTVTAQNPGNFDQLDVNLYWYGANNANQRAVTGVPNPHFSPGRPTVIYIHGWQKDTTTQRRRESFNRSGTQQGTDVARAWIDKGWNVGIFYWNQLSDEGEVKDAEAKIYTVDKSKFTNATRWRAANGNYYAGPNLTVTQQFVNVYKAAMSGYYGSEVRLAGHSLGSQLAVTAASALWKEGKAGTLPAAQVPKRVALLDFAYLNGPHSWINNQWTGEVGRALVRENRHEIAYETYRTSGSTSNGFIGDTNQGLIDMITLIEVKPWMFGAFDFGNKHNFAPGYYFESMGYPAPTVRCTGRAVPSAAVATSTVHSLSYWVSKFSQIGGEYTSTPGDDAWDQKSDGC
jgi:hypothetical protein